MTSSSSSWPATFAEAVHGVLLRRLPPDRGGPELEQLSRDLVAALEQGELDLPLTPERRAAARASGWLVGPVSPLLCRGDRIGWRRWLEAMDAVVEQLLDRHPPECPPAQPCPQPSANLNAEQRAAVLALDQVAVVLLSGGPGTGKTSTVVDLLQRARARHPGQRIGLAAPTGKAARRLGDAVRRTANHKTAGHKTAGQNTLEDLPCFTLHRWLEAAGDGFRRDRQRPIELDLLVIDEMSMVDLNLMQALLEALPSTCRLVLVGDPAQLPPVGSGAVWQRLQESSSRDRFGVGAVHLRRTYRNRGALAALATTLREGGMAEFRQHLEGLPASANVEHVSAGVQRLPAQVRDRWRERHQRLAALAVGLLSCAEEDLERAAAPLMAMLDQELLLCPRRRGPWSLEDVHRTLLGSSSWRDPARWPEGLPVICGGNQPELGLSNGDLGVKLGSGDAGRLLFRVIDRQGHARMHRLHPARLSALEPALALTIHRAQGSEADHVSVLWPLQEGSDYDSCLLYTAITRARGSLTLITSEPA